MTRRSSHPTAESPGDADTPGASRSPGSPEGSRLRDPVGRAVSWVDRIAGRHPTVAVPIAVLKKFGDDRGGYWAALVTYYGFVSLFPLLLVFTTVLGFLLQGDVELRQRILDSALSTFPIIGDQIRENLGALEGSVLALAVGLVAALWAGMGVVLTVQDAMDDLWEVPRRSRPSFLKRRLRALIALAVFGVAALAPALLAGVAAAGAGWLRIPALAGTLGLNVLVFGSVFRYLTVARVRWRQVLPGALAAGVAWMALLLAGTWFVDRQLREASALYGFFAIVLGLLSWIYLGAQAMLVSAELNVVLARRLWPRSLTVGPSPPSTQGPDRGGRPPGASAA